jgi:gliding motility-associated-like protein
VNLTVTTPANPINGGPVPSINTTTGQVSVPAGTPAGNYTIVYQICEKLNPNNCDSAIVTVSVWATTIVANDDSGLTINGSVGGISYYNILDNDTFEGVYITNPDLVTITLITSTNPGITLNGSQVVVAAWTPAGDYTLVYEICEKLNPNNCDTATVTVAVNNQIDAQDDTITDIDGTTGNANAGNVLGNDTLNGSNVAIGQVKLTITTPATSIGGAPVPDIDSIGQISIPPGTAGGTYTIVYQICDVINLTNCDDAIVTIDVATVLGCQSIVVHNAFSPNGDNKNATFVIDNIEDTACYPENTVEIYNRWGVLVFETKNYSTTNNFDGTSRGRTTISQSSGLPTGTYYYILNYTSYDNNNKIQTNKKDGYLYLTR